MNEFRFKVGGTYANRKGAYEVVSLSRGDGEMLIRYVDTGEDVETTIDMQRRIWENMNLEQQQAVRDAAEEEASYQKGYGEAFSGLQESDFKTSTEGTTWRSRQNLAGRVALAASEGTPYTFVSWSIYRWPVAFLTHREDYEMAAFELGSRKAKFTIELDDEFAYYGFYVERSDGPMDAVWDWTRMSVALISDQRLADVISRAESEHGARFLGRMSTGEERFHFGNGLAKGARPLWDEELAPRIPVSERVKLLDTIPDGYWGEVYVLAQMPKQQAIDKGVRVAEAMVNLIEELFPLYAASVEPL